MKNTNVTKPLYGGSENILRPRGLANGSVFSVRNRIAITIKNEFLVEDYIPEISVDSDVVGLIQKSKITGAQCGQYAGDEMKGTTTYFINVDNVTATVVGGLKYVGEHIWVDWLDDADLYFETEHPEDFPEGTQMIMSNNGEKALVSLKGSRWDEIRVVTEDMFWDKHLIAKLATDEYREDTNES